MRGLIYSLVLLTCGSMIPGCQSRNESEPTRSADSRSSLQRQEEALTSWGYKVQKREQVGPTQWEQEKFGLEQKSSISVKSVNPVPDQPDTFYRFVLTEEVFPNNEKGKYRLNNLFEKPPDFDEQNMYSFTLRKGYQDDNRIYVIGTDAAKFEPEMQRLAQKLQDLIQKVESTAR